jgi:hypothetical protein
MTDIFLQVSKYLIALAALIGWLRFKSMVPVFLPVLILATLAGSNEYLSKLLINSGQSNALNTNIYSFIEALLIVWQFERWNLFRKTKKWLYAIIIVLFAIWIYETWILYAPAKFSSYFIVAYSFITVLLSISYINTLIGVEMSSIIRNPAFILCIGFIVFYSYSILIELFYLYGLSSSTKFAYSIFNLHKYFNFFLNLTFILAFIWIPRKHKFIQLS